MYSFETVVRFSELDLSGKLSPFSLINYLQDVAIMHTEEVTGGYAKLREDGYAFYITTWQIRIREMPTFDQKIRVHTWIYRMRGLLSSRAFRIEDAEDGRTLVEVDSTWFLNDVKNNQPIHMTQELIDAYGISDEPRPEVGKPVRSIKVKGEGVVCEPITVHPLHLDSNGHVNNARYVELALDAAGDAVPEDISRIDVQYRTAATLGDVMYPVLYTQENAIVVDLTDEDGSTFAIVRLHTSEDEDA